MTKETPLIEAVNKFSEHRVSCLPVVDKAGKCVDILCKYDVMQQLASATSFHGSQINVAMSLEHKQQYFDEVISCRGILNAQPVYLRLCQVQNRIFQ